MTGNERSSVFWILGLVVVVLFSAIVWGTPGFFISAIVAVVVWVLVVRGPQIKLPVVSHEERQRAANLSDAGVLAAQQGDYAKAASLFEQAARGGNPNGQYHYGLFHLFGLNGIAKNSSTAATWFRKAGAQGQADALHNLGMLLEGGEGVAKNPGEAVACFQKAADLGSADAQVRLGAKYRSGDGVQTDYGRALELFRKAAAQGNSAAQNNLGEMYGLGLGVGKDEFEAAAWYRKAAEQGHTGSQYILGQRCRVGLGVTQNWPEAAGWYRTSGEQGCNMQALVAYGSCLAGGHGVPKDIVEAYARFHAAAALAEDNEVRGQATSAKATAWSMLNSAEQPRATARAGEFLRVLSERCEALRKAESNIRW